VQAIISILRHYWIAQRDYAVVLNRLVVRRHQELRKSYGCYRHADLPITRTRTCWPDVNFPSAGGTNIPTADRIDFEPGRSRKKPVVERLKLTSDPEFARGFQGAPGALSEVVTQQPARYSDGAAGYRRPSCLYIAAPSKNPRARRRR